MACGSCGGGARARRVVGADGQLKPVSAKTTTYVWKWIPFAAGVEGKEFATNREAREWVKEGNPGSVIGQPVG
jgi:hypothetical protein